MMPVTSATTSTTSTPPVPKAAEYTISELVLLFFKEKAKDIAKAGSYLAFWTTQAIPDLPPNVTAFSNTLRDFKNFVSVTEVPDKLCTLGGSVTTLFAAFSSATIEKVGAAGRKVFKDTMSFINATADSIDFAKLFIPLDKEILRWVSGINFAATLGFAGNGAVEQIQNINNMNKIDPRRTTFYLINLARDISYVALGIIGLSSFITATPLVPWTVVACLTSGLTFSIGGYFYEKLFDPENKGKNLNPAIVIENDLNQRNYERRLA